MSYVLLSLGSRSIRLAASVQGLFLLQLQLYLNVNTDILINILIIFVQN